MTLEQTVKYSQNDCFHEEIERSCTIVAEPSKMGVPMVFTSKSGSILVFVVLVSIVVSVSLPVRSSDGLGLAKFVVLRIKYSNPTRC